MGAQPPDVVLDTGTSGDLRPLPSSAGTSSSSSSGGGGTSGGGGGGHQHPRSPQAPDEVEPPASAGNEQQQLQVPTRWSNAAYGTHRSSCEDGVSRGPSCTGGGVKAGDVAASLAQPAAAAAGDEEVGAASGCRVWGSNVIGAAMAHTWPRGLAPAVSTATRLMQACGQV